MNNLNLIGCALFLFLLTSFKPASKCAYAGSNMNFIKTQTEKALAKEDLQLVRYHTFKALNAIEKSKKRISACKCEYASISIEESAYLLKRASRVNDVKDSKDLLERALENTVSSMHALKVHDEEHTRNKSLTLNNTSKSEGTKASKSLNTVSYQEKIDISLEKYRKSLNKVVQTVNCKDAREFAENIYQKCEQELMKEELSEPKKYYNLQTQAITAEALERIALECDS